jgi:hypothetical protein
LPNIGKFRDHSIDPIKRINLLSSQISLVQLSELRRSAFSVATLLFLYLCSRCYKMVIFSTTYIRYHGQGSNDQGSNVRGSNVRGSNFIISTRGRTNRGRTPQGRTFVGWNVWGSNNFWGSKMRIKSWRKLKKIQESGQQFSKNLVENVLNS